VLVGGRARSPLGAVPAEHHGQQRRRRRSDLSRPPPLGHGGIGDGYLHATFGNSRGVRRLEGSKLFFPEEQPDVIAEEARRLWGVA
jgi:hypothetical protein